VPEKFVAVIKCEFLNYFVLLAEVSKTVDMYVFLFNDILLLTKIKKAPRKVSQWATFAVCICCKKNFKINLNSFNVALYVQTSNNSKSKISDMGTIQGILFGIAAQIH